VKRRAPALVAVAAALSAACGYHAVYGRAGAERVHVVLARSVVADAVAAGEVVSGVREELAREGALASGDGYPRVEVEVTRLDEGSDAIGAATASGAAGGRVPVARATEVGVVARAWLVRAAGGAQERDTGDVRALVDEGTTRVSSESGGGLAAPSAADAFRHDDAVRAAARLAGIRLGRRILGRPAPEVDSLDDSRGRGP
jgi:hypothetical protein